MLWRYPGLLLLMIAIVAIGLAQGFGKLSSAPEAGPSITGYPSRITDGDTIRMGDTRIRLQGIDAPEMDTPEGVEARQPLVAIVGGSSVACDDTGQRSYDRIVAVCRLPGGRDLAEAMVEDGWARDWPRFSGGRYAPAQLRARIAHRGMYGR